MPARLAITIKMINFSSYPIHNLNLSAAPYKIVLPIHFYSYKCRGMHPPIAASADPKHRYYQLQKYVKVRSERETQDC